MQGIPLCAAVWVYTGFAFAASLALADVCVAPDAVVASLGAYPAVHMSPSDLQYYATCDVVRGGRSRALPVHNAASVAGLARALRMGDIACCGLALVWLPAA